MNKNLDYHLIAARAEDAITDSARIDAIMQHITPKPDRFTASLRHSPAFVASVATIGLLVISGSAYAITQLWSQGASTINKSQPGPRATYTIISKDCGPQTIKEQLEKKRNSHLTDQDVQQMIAANCELANIFAWANAQWPNDIDRIDHITPNAVSQNLHYTQVSSPLQLRSLSDTQLSTNGVYDPAGRYNFSIDRDTQFVANSTHASASQFAVGDVVVVVTQKLFSQQNDSDCSIRGCSSKNLNDRTTTKVIVKLAHAPTDYTNAREFIWVGPCSNNDKEYCPSPRDSISLFERDGSTIFVLREASGKIVAYDASSITIQTSSGRQLTLKTDENLIAKFNARTPSGFTVEKGDTLWLNYLSKDPMPANNTIDFINLMSVRLVVESVTDHIKY